MRRKFLLVLLLIPAIPLIAYLGFPWYAKSLLNLVLTDKKLAVEVLEVHRPKWNFITVPNLSLTHATGRVSVVDATIHWNRRFSDFRIVAKETNIAFAAAEDKQDKEFSPAEYLPGNFLPELPSIDLAAQAVQVSRLADQETILLARLKEVRLLNRPAGLELNAILVGEKQYATAVSITHENAFAIAISPTSADKSSFSVTGKAEDTPDGFTLTFAADIDMQQPMYFNTRLDNAMGGFVGVVNTAMELRFKNFALLTDSVIAATGFIKADIEIPAREIKLRIAAASQLDLDNGDWTMSLSPLPASGPDLIKFEMVHDNKHHLLAAALPKSIAISGSFKSNIGINADAQSVITLNYSINGDSIAKARLSEFNWNGLLPGNQQFRSSFHADVSADSANLLALEGIEDVQLDGASLRLSAGVELRDDTAQFNIKNNTTFVADKVVINGVALNKVEMTIPPQEAVIAFADTSISPVSFTLTAKTLTSNGYLLSPLQVNAVAQLTKAQGQLRLTSEKTIFRKAIKGKAFKVPPYRIVANVSFPESASASATIQMLNQCDKPLLNVKWVFDGLLDITTEHRFSPQDSLRRWLNLSDLTADSTQGTMAASVKWDTNKPNTFPRLSLQLNQVDITGSLGTFDNVQLSLSTLQSKSNGNYQLEARVQNINIGAEIKNLVVRTDFIHSNAGLTARIHEVNGKVLGGRAFIEDQQWVLGQTSTIDVQLENLALAELVKTQNIDSITTTGKLTGVIPIRLDKEGGFALAGGRLSDINGGTIRYQSALAESEGLNDQLQLTLDVLKNFKYDVLNTLIEYNDGNLVLKSNVRGRNPNVGGGQQIDLNLNTEVNLKSAFQAMRLQAGLEAQVENLFSAGEESSLPFCQQPL